MLSPFGVLMYESVVSEALEPENGLVCGSSENSKSGVLVAGSGGPIGRGMDEGHFCASSIDSGAGPNDP